MSAILIVEDEKHLADGLRFNLEAEGYDVTVAATGEQALKLMLADGIGYDVVVLDVMLPGKDGFYVLECLRENSPQARVILFASSSLAHEVRRARELGARGFLPKQVTLEQLSSSIHAVHEGKTCWEHSTTVPQPLMEALSARELETLDGLRLGHTNAMIAKVLGISEHTVKHHVKAVCDKLEASDRTEAVARAFELGLLS